MLRKKFGRKYIMKKVLALTFALIIALTASVTVFAATTTVTPNMKNTCPYCGVEFDDEATYNKHISETIPVENHIRQCPYHGEGYKDGGCTAQFVIQAEYDKHVNICPFKGTKELTTEEKIEQFIDDIDWKELGNKVVDLVKKIPFTDIINKIVDLVKNINFDEVFGSIGDLVK